MKWKRSTALLSLSPADLKVMAQCKMPIHELVPAKRPNKNIPPLWSVLSYVMLQSHEGYVNIWYHYRSLLEVAGNTKPYYRPKHLSKSGGGYRQIRVPSSTLCYQQRYITDNILSGLPVDSHAYAYRKGVCPADCAKPHVGRDVLIHLDLQDFFHSITEDMVYVTLLEQTGYAKSLCRFLAQMCCLQGRLPQGAPSSPMLSNIVFCNCDRALAQFAAQHDLHYSRYSDDLFFSGSHSTDVPQVIREVSTILQSHGFRLNKEKTTVRRRQHRQAVLGLTVNDRVQVTRDYRRKLLQEVYYLEKFGKNSRDAVASGNYLRYLQQLQGKLAYALQFDPDNGRLRDAQATVIRMISQHNFLWEHGFL